MIPNYSCVATNGTLSGATVSSPAACKGTSNDVWYYFTATSAKHTVAVSPSSSFDIVLQVFSGSTCASLTPALSLFCRDAAGAGKEETVSLIDLTTGQKYFYRIHDYSGASTGAFTTCVTMPPANDDCSIANAITVAVDGACQNGDGTFATQSEAGCTGTTANDDVWYKFTATKTTHFINVNAATGYNPVVELYLNCTTKFTPAFCNDASFPLSASGSASISGLSVGVTYYYRVYDNASTNPTNMTFTTCVNSPAANDECANSQLLVANTACNPTFGDVGSASASIGASLEDVWYSFQAISTTQFITVTGSGNFDPIIDVFTGCPGSTSPLKSLNTSNTITENSSISGLTVGTTYYYRVYNYVSTNPTQTTFTTCVSNPVTNDDCSNSKPLTPGSTCNPIAGDVGYATASIAANLEDVWYSFQASTTTHYLTVSAFGSFNPIIDVYSGCPGSNPILKTLNSSTSPIENGFISGLTIGTTYYYRVYDKSTTTIPDQTNFTTCVTEGVINDECSGAIALIPKATCSATSGDLSIATASIGADLEDVWYSFTAAATSQFFNATGSGNLDPVIEIFTTCPTGTTALKKIDNTTSITENGFISSLVIGTKYYYRVYHKSTVNPTVTSFTTCVTNPATNDECAGAPLISTGATCNAVAGDFKNATALLTPSIEDLWYSFKATATTQFITVTGGGNFDPLIDVYTTCPSGTVLKQISTNSSITENGFVSGLTINATYYYRVYNSSTTNPSQTSFSTCVTDPAPNDNCSGAIVVTPGSNCSPINGDVGNATNSLVSGYEDVWYSFTAAAKTQFFNVTGSGNFNPVIEIYAACPTGAYIKKIDASITNTTTLYGFVSGLTIGTIYYYRVYNSSPNTPTVTAFTTCVTNPATNDECGGAPLLTTGATCNPVSGDLKNSTYSLTLDYEDLWYSFRATATTQFITVSGGGNFDPVIDVYNSCPSGSTLKNLNSSSTTSENGFLTGLTIGTVYYYRVYNNNNTNPSVTNFNTCVTDPALNDNCSGAITVIPDQNCSPTNGDVGNASNSLALNYEDVWYSFSSKATTQFVNVTGSGNFNPVIEIYAACPTGTALKKIDISTSTSENGFISGLTIGSIYFYRVYNSSTTNPTTTSFTTCVTNPIINDECSGAVSLTVNDACDFVTKTNLSATDATTNPTCDVAYNEVWFKAVVPANGQLYVFTEQISSSLYQGGGLQILRGASCSGFTSLSCVAGATSMPSAQVTTGLIAGETVYVRVWGSTTSDVGDFKICVSSPPSCGSNPAAGDVCSNATYICNLNGYCGSTLKCSPPTVTTNCYNSDKPGDLMSKINSTPGNSGVTIENNSWLSFTASATSASFTVYVSNCGGIQLGVFEAATCNDFTLHSSFFNGKNTPFVVNATNLIPGNKYLIMIDGNSGAVCDYKIAAAYGFATLDAGEDFTICKGSSTITLNAIGPAGVTYVWKNGSTVVGSSLSPSLTIAAPTVETTYTVEISGSTFCSAMTDDVVVYVKNPPVVTVNDATICSGGSATITATVTPPGNFDYTWTVPAGAGDPGNVASFSANIAGNYSVAISNKASVLCNTDFDDVDLGLNGSSSIFEHSSFPCWKTVDGDDRIEVWSTSVTVPSYSGKQFLELNANVASTLYQDFIVVPNTSVSISFAHRGREGVDVVRVELGPVGGPYVSLGEFSDGKTAWGFHTLNYTFPNDGVTNYSLRFKCVSSNGVLNSSLGNFLDAISIVSQDCPTQSNLGVLSVGNPTLVITNPASDCTSSTVDLTASAVTAGSNSGLVFTYWMDIAATVPIPPANGTSNAINTAAFYYIKGSSSSSSTCYSIKQVEVKLKSSPTVTVPNDIEVCNGNAIATTAFSSSPTGATFAWTNNNTAIGLVASGTGNITTFNGANTGTSQITSTITVTPTLGACPGTAKTYTIKVNPGASIQTKSDEICTGEAFSITSIAADVIPTSNMKYTWTVANVPGISGNSDNSTGVTTISGITQTLNNSTSATLLIKYVVTASYGILPNICSSTFEINVKVNPKPVIKVKSAVICSGESFTVQTDATDLIPTTNMKYTWTVANVTSITGNLDNSTGVTNYSDIKQLLNNSTTLAVSNKYVVTAIYGISPEVCSSTFDVNVKVNPGAVIQAKTDIICTGESFAITPSLLDVIPSGTMKYTWTVANVTGISGNSDNTVGVTIFPDIKQTLNNTTLAPITIKYVVTAIYGTTPDICSSNFDIDVTVNPKPVIKVKSDIICSNESFVIPTDATDIVPATNMKYSWTVANVPGITGNSNSSTSVSSISGITQLLTNTTSSPLTIKYVVTSTYGIAPEECSSTFDVNVKVNPLKVIQNKTDIICSGESFVIVATATDVIPTDIIKYTWSSTSVSGLSGNTNNTAGVTNLSNITEQLTNNTLAPIVIKYTAQAIYGTSPEICSSNFDIDVTVNPKPVINVKSDIICSTGSFVIPNDPTDIIPSANMKYTWNVANVSGISGNSDNTIGVQNLSGIPQALTNSTVGPLPIKYTVTATYGTSPEICVTNFDLNITVNPIPKINSKSDIICSNEGFIIPTDPTDLIPNSNMNYTWTVANITGISGNSNNSSGVTTLSGITQTLINSTTAQLPIKYVVTANYGTSPEICSSNFDIDITVNPKPIIKVKSDIVCPNEAFVISPDPTDLIPTSTMKYTWTVANVSGITGNLDNSSGVTNMNGITQTLVNTSIAPLIIKYIVTASYGTSPEICSTNFDATITVNPMPKIQTKIDEICSGETFGFTSDIADIVPTSNMKYTWIAPAISGITGNSDNTSGISSFSSIAQLLNNSTTNPKTIKYIINATYGVAPESCSNPFDLNVTVNPTPSITGVSTVCISTTSTLTGSGTSASTNAWTSTTPSIVTINSSSGLITGVSKGTSNITYIDNKGCKNNVTINVPDPIITGVLFVCEGNTTQLSSTGINATTNPWISNQNSIATIDNSGIVTGVLAGNTVITYVDQDGCKKTANLKVNPTPKVNFISDVNKGCLPLNVMFTNNSLPKSDSVVWDFGDGNTIPLQQNNSEIKHVFTKAGCFDISLLSYSNGCSNQLKNTQMICTLPQAEASFVVNKTEGTTVDPIIVFTNTSKNASIYGWSFGDNTGSELEDVIHQFEFEKGLYLVTLVADNDQGCSDTTEQLIKIVEELVFYVPNSFTPDEDDFNKFFKPVFTSGYDPLNFKMYIFNRWGELVFETHDSEKGWNGNYGLDGIKCQDGLYIWKIHYKELYKDKDKIVTGNVILMR